MLSTSSPIEVRIRLSLSGSIVTGRYSLNHLYEIVIFREDFDQCEDIAKRSKEGKEVKRAESEGAIIFLPCINEMESGYNSTDFSGNLDAY
jgi:hypothetical protein